MWFKDDVRNILLGLELSSAQSAGYSRDREIEAFRAGYRAAILAAAASFGILVVGLSSDLSAPAGQKQVAARSTGQGQE